MFIPSRHLHALINTAFMGFLQIPVFYLHLLRIEKRKYFVWFGICCVKRVGGVQVKLFEPRQSKRSLESVYRVQVKGFIKRKRSIQCVIFCIMAMIFGMFSVSADHLIPRCSLEIAAKPCT